VKYGSALYGSGTYGEPVATPSSLTRLFYILDSSEVLLCVLSNELPGACPIIDLIVTQEAQEGGCYVDTCELIIPATHADAAYVTGGNYLVFKDLDDAWQEYKIIETERIDSGNGSQIVATCEHAFYELLGDFIDDIRPETTTSAAVTQILADTRWETGTAADLGTHYARIYKTSVLAGLVSIATAWSGELKFSVTYTGGAITARTVDILAQRGSVTGKIFAFKKDLKEIRYTVNLKNLATALIGRGKGIDVEPVVGDDPAYGRRLEFEEVVWTVAGGDDADKPAGQNWIGDDTAAAAYGPAGRHIKTVVNFDNCTVAEDLLQLTYDELQIRKVPETTYELSAIALETIAGLSHEKVRLGDTVNVINGAVTPVLSATARVVEITRSYIDPRNCNVVIGNYIPKTSNTNLTVQTQQTSLVSRSGVWDKAAIVETPTAPTGPVAITADAHVISNHTTTNYNNTYMSIGEGSTGIISEIFLNFDLSSLTAGDITSATLSLYQYDDADDWLSPSIEVACELCGAAWTETGINYGNKPANLAGTPQALTTFSNNISSSVDFDVTDHIQAIVDGDTFNGFRLRYTGTASSTRKFFRSRSYGDSAKWPTLTIVQA